MQTFEQMARGLGTAEVSFRGRPLTLRALTHYQRRKIRQQDPAPVMPYKTDPQTGRPTSEPDPANACFLDLTRNWTVRVRLTDLAYALDLTTASGLACPPVDDGAALLAWQKQAVSEIEHGMTSAEIEWLLQQLDEIESGRENSQNPSSAGPAAPRESSRSGPARP